MWNWGWYRGHRSRTTRLAELLGFYAGFEQVHPRGMVARPRNRVNGNPNVSLALRWSDLPRCTCQHHRTEAESGLFEVFVANGKACVGIGPWVAEGLVQEQYGVPVLRADRLSRALSGGLPDIRDASTSVG